MIEPLALKRMYETKTPRSISDANGPGRQLGRMAFAVQGEVKVEVNHNNTDERNWTESVELDILSVVIPGMKYLQGTASSAVDPLKMKVSNAYSVPRTRKPLDSHRSALWSALD